MREKFEDEGTGNLIWGVWYADFEVRLWQNLQLRCGVFGEPVCIGKKEDQIPEISRQDGVENGEKKVEYEGKYVRSLHPLHYFCGHTWIHLNRCSLFRLFENLHGEVASTRADFQHFVCRFQICLNRASTMRNSELLGHSFKRTTSTILPYMSNTPLSRNRCIPLACFWECAGQNEQCWRLDWSLVHWCRLGSWLMYMRKFIPSTNYYK